MTYSRFKGSNETRLELALGKQICFFEKNFLDLDNEDATVSSSHANEFIGYVRTRSLLGAWLTTNSVDADEVSIEMDLAGSYNIDRVIIADHNLKSFTLEQYDFDTGIWSELFSATDETRDTTEIALDEFYGRRFKLTIYGTQVPNSDKRINRILITKKIGQFSYWPKIESPTIDRGKNIRTTLSGKKAVLRTVGAFQCRLSIENWRNAEDLELIERLYRQVQGFQVWLSGGDETQFFYAAESYRAKDIYLMGFSNDFKPTIKDGIYPNGMNIALDLVEVVR